MPFDRSCIDLPFKILVAGCGTGRHAISAAARYPQSHVTAIDLSRASLAYGLRKAEECRISERIEFLHADILSMKEWPGTFDIIECSGVLHHMKDPFEGWKILTDILSPNGCMKIGLYSEVAREEVVKARNIIHERSYPTTLEGIRSLRQYILDLPTENPTRQYLLGSSDFYSTSLIRDLVFHIQEHRFTLPEVESMMEKLGLSCLYVLSNDIKTLNRYDSRFPENPDRNNLKNWDLLEQSFPLTFISMYQFWVQKKTSA